LEKIEYFKHELTVFWHKLLPLLEKAKDAPRIMWEGAATEPGGKLFMGFALLTFAASILYVLYAFIKASWREKLHMLFIALIVLIVLFIIFFNII